VSRAWLGGDAQLVTLAVHPTNAQIVYGGGSGIYRSEDGGTSWTLLDPKIEVRALAIVPGDPRLLYAVTGEGIAHSSDGGTSWTHRCSDRLVNGPAEFLDTISISTGPHPIILLARPTRPDLSSPSPGICRDTAVQRYDLHKGWRQSKEGLPVFIQEH
jgi:hypothetical protein